MPGPRHLSIAVSACASRCRYRAYMEPVGPESVVRAESPPLEGRSIYLLSARLTNMAGCGMVIFVCIWFAAFVSSAVAQEHREHLKAGGPMFVLFISVLMLLAAVMIYRALRSARLGVTVTPSGITIQNMNRDLQIGWSDIARFEAVVVGAFQFRSSVGLVRLKDGSAQLIQGTQIHLGIWQHKNDKLNQCVLRLNGLLAGATGATTGSVVPSAQTLGLDR